ncbi:MAG: hypothetical protein NVSMB27_38620 [Ktedonobacteraceae bacterium]
MLLMDLHLWLVLVVRHLWNCCPSVKDGQWKPDTDTHKLYLIASSK